MTRGSGSRAQRVRQSPFELSRRGKVCFLLVIAVVGFSAFVLVPLTGISRIVVSALAALASGNLIGRVLQGRSLLKVRLPPPGSSAADVRGQWSISSSGALETERKESANNSLDGLPKNMQWIFSRYRSVRGMGFCLELQGSPISIADRFVRIGSTGKGAYLWLNRASGGIRNTQPQIDPGSIEDDFLDIWTFVDETCSDLDPRHAALKGR